MNYERKVIISVVVYCILFGLWGFSFGRIVGYEQATNKEKIERVNLPILQIL